jgi:hypothetical protein
MLDSVQYLSLNESDFAQVFTGHCQFGFVGSIDFNCTTVTVFIAASGVFSVTLPLHNVSI